jgi:Tol biopolymer transport system component
MTSRTVRTSRALFCLAALALVSCSHDRPTETSTGAVRVAISTSGADTDADGYTLTLDGSQSTVVGSNDVAYFASVAPGAHSIVVGGMATNCSAAPPTVNVTAGATAEVNLSVTCVPSVATLRVVASPTGIDPDVAYVLTVGTQPPRLLLANDSLDFPALKSGSYAVRIVGTATNCTVAGSATRTTVVAFGVASVERFAVTCTPRISRILFSSTRAGTYDLYTIASTGSDVVVRLTSGVGALHGVWSPDGKRIAYHKLSADGRFDIHVMNADGTNDVQLTSDPLDDIYPQWSPDGTQIAFERTYQIGTPANAVWVMNADGSDQRGVKGGGRPAWSPDGTRIAFNASVDLGPNRIYTMRADGTDVVQLPAGTYPRWSPDGRRIVFLSPPHDGVTSDIFLMNADGSGVTNLTRSPAGFANEDPAWSPDGQRIAFRDNSGQIYVMKPDGSGVTNISGSPSGDFGPDWYP